MVRWRPLTVDYFKIILLLIIYLCFSGVMEWSFDFEALLRNNEKKHKSRPSQFLSVAGGVQKRLETNIKNRKSNRLSVFDRIRNLPRCESPKPVNTAQLKVEHRRQQLEKWKVEKEKKKKEAAASKKQPFRAGVPHAPLKFVPPPPPPKPSSSGRVTRSQTVKTVVKRKPSPSKTATQSFAPKNATFKAPEIKNLVKLPKLAPPMKNKKKVNSNITFEPILPNANSVKQTRSRALLKKQNATEPKAYPCGKIFDTRNTTKKPIPKSVQLGKKTVQSSSSSSDIEPSSNIIKRIKTPGPGKSSAKDTKNITPKKLTLESTSEEKQSSDSSSFEKSPRNSFRLVFTSETSESSLDKLSDIDSSSKQNTVIIKSRKSLPKNFTRTSSNASSDTHSSDIDLIVVRKTPRKSLPSTPKNRTVPKSESSSEEKLRSPKSPVELPLTPELMETAKKISPCVTLSRGKDNARREMKWKIDEGMLDDDTCDIENVDHFRRQHASEVKRMTEMCLAWDKVLEQTALPDPIQEAVLAAVGQARLLMSQKLAQFAALVERCARPDAAQALVTPADLHGFWDMVFMQVENVDMRFMKLEELRARGWVEEAPSEVQRKAVKQRAARPAARPARPAAPSRLRGVIAAARKAKKQEATESTSPTSSEQSPADTKTFEAGFFCVRSPVRSPSCHSATPTSKPSLLKAVLSSEAQKASASKNSASFAMLRAAVLGKNVEYDGIEPLQQTPQMTPINFSATPGRSILKSTNKASTKKSSKKSIKLVLFNDSDHEAQDSFVEREREIEKEIKANQQTPPVHKLTDSGIAMDTDKNSEHKNSEKSKPKLQRHDAVELSPVMTRSRRKSVQTPVATSEDTPKRSTRKKVLEETDMNIVNAGKTPKHTARKKKVVDTNSDVKTPKRSTRKKDLQDVESNVVDDRTPQRATRRRKSAALIDLLT